MKDSVVSGGGSVLSGRFALAAVLASVAWTVGAEPMPLRDEALKQALAGKTVELDTPLGISIPIVFQANGLMSGKAGALAYFLGADADRGRWWVADGKLCQKWFKWLDAQPNCMRLAKDGHRLFWQRDDGMSGTATIVASLPPGAETGPHGLGGPPIEAAVETRRSLTATQPPAAIKPVSLHVPAAIVPPAPKRVTRASAPVAQPERDPSADIEAGGGPSPQWGPVLLALSVVADRPPGSEQDYRWCTAPGTAGGTGGDASPELIVIARLPYSSAEWPGEATACLTAEPALRHVARLGIEPR